MHHVACAHCKQTGTCTSGANGKGCHRCVARRVGRGRDPGIWKRFGRRSEPLPEDGDHVGLVCSVCENKGLAELSSDKWTYRYPAFLAAGIILLGFSASWRKD